MKPLYRNLFLLFGIAAIVVLYSVPNFLTDKNLVFLGQ